MTTAARAHDLWLTLAQVIPVIGLAFGILISRFAKQKRKHPVSRKDHLYATILYAVVCAILAIGWALSLTSIYAPMEWLDSNPDLLLQVVVIVGVVLLTVPVWEYGASLPPKKRDHVEADGS
ncbi:hypothetical protein [Leifsonia sp. NPDC058248]|uniref:hypothetical protein n=1 Tax=Leifsonia sp. NPDC058248 TaxID=3346402 RepID=UPI0036D7E4AE